MKKETMRPDEILIHGEKLASHIMEDWHRWLPDVIGNNNLEFGVEVQYYVSKAIIREVERINGAILLIRSLRDMEWDEFQNTLSPRGYETIDLIWSLVGLDPNNALQIRNREDRLLAIWAKLRGIEED